MFQWLGVLVCLMLVFQGGRARKAGRMTPRGFIAWSVVLICGAVAIVIPDSTTVVANAIGISRGADLVFYLVVLASLGMSLRVHTRIRHLEADLTHLVRTLALGDGSVRRASGELHGEASSSDG